jgi:cobalt-zinc-cadmium resistance protein CzcA
MLRSLIALCLARRPLVLVAFAAFLGIGYAAFTTLNIEAYPDPAPPIIELIAQWPGQSPEEVERYVTIPIEIAVSSTPGLKFLRSNTVYALGFIRLQFEYGRDYNFVRQQTLNRLKDATLPTGVTPVISPAGGISEIMRYQLKGPPGMPLTELKTLQDWVVEHRRRIGARRQDQGIPGRDRSQQDDGLWPDAAADHHGDLVGQFQCRRPHHFDGRAIGQCARARRHRLG